MTRILPLDDLDAAVKQVSEILRNGHLVVIPTDTVYAVVADAFRPDAVQEIFDVKQRASGTPLTVLVRSPRQVSGLVDEVSESAERLMASYWPGPLTLVFDITPELSWELGAGTGRVALRMPADDLCMAVVGEIGPLACTAANVAGREFPTTAEQAMEQLGEPVDLYVAAGPRDESPSTIVDVSRPRADILRPGAIPAVDIAAVASGAVAWGQRPREDDGGAAPDAGEVTKPGLDGPGHGADDP